MCTNPPIPGPQIVESASATTSPDNSNSGPFAYILVACVAGVLLLLAASLASCASAIGQVATGGLDGFGLDYTYDPRYEYVDDSYEDYVPYDLDRIFDDGIETVLS